jgi:hypothetical protein
MSKRLLFLALFLALGGAAVWGVLRWYAEKQEFLPQHLDRELIQKREELGQGSSNQIPVMIMASIALSQAVRLAIGGLGMADENQNRELSDLVLAELNGAQGLAMVDRQSLDKVLRELTMSVSGLVRARDAVRVGKLLHADWFLLGSAASVSGTNLVVVRIVDARTGIMRDGALFARDADVPKLAAALAGFVRESRNAAALTRPRVYLALGAFEDLSLNNRQVSFPAQLRAYLTAAYQGANVTLLERDYVSTLLHEVNLDLAGLTDEALPNGPVPMQAAFWLVDGSYQSYETSSFQVELELCVRRMLGRTRRMQLREDVGEQLFHKVKQSIDVAFDDKSLILVPTRVTELQAQLSMGNELAHFNGLVWIASYTSMGPAAAIRERRNQEEAIRCFETALLLDPGNRQAKMSLAACFRHPTIRRIDEARDYYRQIIEEPIQDGWSGQARQALLDTFWFDSAASRLEWFEAAGSQDTTPEAKTFYRQVAQKAREDAIIAEGNTPKAQQLAENRLFAAMKKWDQDMSNGMYMIDFLNTGLGAFVESFGTNQAGAAQQLVELLPRLNQNTPQLAPHILAGVVSYQVDTNAPVIAEFERSFAQNSEHPERVPRPAYYAALLAGPLYYWCRDHGLYGLGAKLIEYRMKAAQQGKADPLDDERKMALAFSYLADERWQEALQVFQTWSNRPVFMGNRGLWGSAFTAVATARQATYCRQKLGLPVPKDPSELDLGKSCLCLHPAGAFTTDADDLWITVKGNLMRLDFGLQTNLSFKLPIEPATAVNWISATPSHVWIATAGAGLLQFDKASHQCDHFTEADGLMMNFVNQVYPEGDTLWLGYGSDIGGGLGKLDLRSRKCTSFARSLFASQSPSKPSSATNSTALGTDALPPRKAVGKVCVGSGGDLWFTEGGRLRRYRSSDAWEEFPQAGPCSVFALKRDTVFVGGYLLYQQQMDEKKPGLAGLTMLDPNTGKCRQVPALDGLPHQMVSALTVDGDNVWLGGMGFVALVDPQQNKVLKYGYINAQAVDRIQVAGGYLWVQFNQHLYRAALN